MARVDQILSRLGYCSRSEARDWIKAGRITAGGSPVSDPGQQQEAMLLSVDGEPLDHPEGILLLMNKSIGLVCSHDRAEGPSVYDALPERWRRRRPLLTSVGRLDKETSGLLLLTDQSPLVHRLTSPRHKVPKVYRVTTDRDLPMELVPRFASGTLRLDGDEPPCAPADLRLTAARSAELTVTEGRYHQVRRMFAACGIAVLALHRARFGDLELDGLAPGGWRELPLNQFICK